MALDERRSPLPGDPPHLRVMFSILGLEEIPGPEDNPRILAMFRAAGFPEIVDDETAWCAACENWALAQVKFKGTGSLLARSFLDWGVEIAEADARRGDLVIIKRGNSTWQGHVFNLLYFDGDRVVGIGGNQGRVGAVTISSYPRSAILGVRRPIEQGRALAGPQTETATVGRPTPKHDASPGMVEAVQRALIAKGYNEVGMPDGIYGSKTRGAVLAFEADHDLPLSGAINGDLLAAVLSATPRERSPAREEGRPEDATVLKNSDVIGTIATCTTGAGAIKVADELASSIEQGAGIASRIKDALSPFTSIIAEHWPVLLIAGGLALIVLTLRNKRSVIEGFRDGKIAR